MTYARKKNGKKFGIFKKNDYICTRFSRKLASECIKVVYSAKYVNLVRESTINDENQDSVYQH